MTELLIKTTRCRKTGTEIDLIDLGPQEEKWGYTEARFETICVAHATVCAHYTKSLAIEFMAHPDEWCELCREQCEEAA